MKEVSVKKLKEKLENKLISGLAVDIDETISDTSTYWFEEAIKKFGKPNNKTTKEIIDEYVLIQNIPFWNKLEIESWLLDARKNLDFHSKPLPIIGALDTLKEIDKKIKIVAYITARPEFLRETTINWLEKHGFPKADLIHMPNKNEHSESNLWKANVLEYLYPQVSGIIDDNPLLVKEISETYQGDIYLIRNKKLKRYNSNIYPCENWNEVKDYLIN
jgi:predicted secreted acid phosphatase